VAAVGLAAIALGGGVAAGLQRSQAGPVALAAGPYRGSDPSTIQFSGDGGDVVSDIRWSSWGSQTAVGLGTVGLDNCTPNCAEGSFTYVPATITLSNPATEGTAPVWTSMTESYDGRTLHFSYSGRWAQAAS
jgi:hypothetical protein